MFCSTSITSHLLRGAAAAALIFSAIYLRQFALLWSVLAVGGALVLMRGCPMCWTLGLFATIGQRLDVCGKPRSDA